MIKKWMKANFSSDKICEGVDEIDYQGLYNEGIRLILLDIDNTLAVHGSSQADDYAKSAVAQMRSANLMIVILSNARRQRAQAFADSLQLEAEGMAGKPSPKALLKVCDRHSIAVTAACMIGLRRLRTACSWRQREWLESHPPKRF